MSVTKDLKIEILVFSLLGIVLSLIGIKEIASKVEKSKSGESFIKLIYGKGRNVQYILLYANIAITGGLILMILDDLFGILGGDRKKGYMILLTLIPIIFASLLTYASVEYIKEDVDMFFGYQKTEHKKENFWVKNSGNTMCSIFISFYILIIFFTFADDLIYRFLPEPPPRALTPEEQKFYLEQEKLLPKVNQLKLVLLYYYLGLVFASFIIMTTVFFSDQSTDTYQYIFCNTTYKKGQGYSGGSSSSSGGGGSSSSSDGGGSSSGGGGGGGGSSGGGGGGGGGY